MRSACSFSKYLLRKGYVIFQRRASSTITVSKENTIFQEPQGKLEYALKPKMAEALNNPKVYHPVLQRDLENLLKLLEPDKQHTRLRASSFARVQELLQTFNDESGDGPYELVDVSFNTLKGTQDVRAAPLEYAIVDKSRPIGLTPSFEGKHLPVPYDAVALASALGSIGFRGIIRDTKPEIFGQSTTAETEEIKWLAAEYEWDERGVIDPTFRAFSSLYPVLPPTLLIRPTNENEPPIHIHPAHPSNLLRWGIEQQLCSKCRALPKLSTLLWLWAQSQNLSCFTQETCLFLVLSFFQLYQGAKLFMNPTTDLLSLQPSGGLDMARSFEKQLNEGFWIRQDCLPEPKYFRSNVRQIASFSNISLDKLGPLLLRLFLHCAGLMPKVTSKTYIDFCGGTLYPRPVRGAFLDRPADPKLAIECMEDSPMIPPEVGADEFTQAIPTFWRHQALILRDPLVPHHNISHLVTRDALACFVGQAEKASIALRRGHPITDIFGAHLASISGLRENNSQGYKANGQHQADTTPIMHRGVPWPDILPILPVDSSIIALRSKTIRRIQNAIRKTFGREYSVECFGSTRYGVDVSSSDLDLVIKDPRRKDRNKPDTGRLPAIYNLNKVSQCLRMNGFKILKIIPKAIVPIVKVQDKRTHIYCDINVNDQLGLRNTLLIKKYCELNPILRPLLLAIKLWAKPLGLNNPAADNGGPTTFSSYALALMTIGFLQRDNLLPNLQAGLPTLSEKELESYIFWYRTSRGKAGAIRCDTRFHKGLAWVSDCNPQPDLNELLIRWFEYWGSQFVFMTDIVSIRDGDILHTDPSLRVLIQKHKSRGKKKKKDVAVFPDEAPLILDETVQKLDEKNEANPDADESIIGTDLQSNSFSESTAIVATGTKEDMSSESSFDLRNGQLPQNWRRSPLIVADPFIPTKNTTGAINFRILEKFTAECRRMVFFLKRGYEYKDLLVSEK